MTLTAPIPRPARHVAKVVPLDTAAIRAILARFHHTDLRATLLPTLLSGVSGLSRAGVRLDTPRAVLGKALLGQLVAEIDRREAEPDAAPVARRPPVVAAPSGAYSAVYAGLCNAPRRFYTYA